MKLFVLTLLLAIGALADTVSNIKFAQRWPWNGKVDIDYTLTKTTSKTTPVFSVDFYVRVNGGEATKLQKLEGDGATGIILGDGQKRTTWDASQDLVSQVNSDDVQIAVVATDVTEEATYLKLDLETYKMETSTVGPSVSSNAPSKYAELWFRRIENGTFVMGSNPSEPGRVGNETEHTVTLTKAYYIGVFELTQGQYDRINADGTSTAVTPQGYISYNTLRGTSYGATWPTKNDHRVDATSFFGKLRTKTGNGLIFDLPTEAQWEAAGRWKGTVGNGTNDYYGSSVWNNGVQFDSSYSGLGDVAWYYGNSGIATYETHEVGLKAPSTIGTYDMHGNMWEWCLDWYSNLGPQAVSDPEGPASGTERLGRGGSYYAAAYFCRMARRVNFAPSLVGDNLGCRVALLP